MDLFLNEFSDVNFPAFWWLLARFKQFSFKCHLLKKKKSFKCLICTFIFFNAIPPGDFNPNP